MTTTARQAGPLQGILLTLPITMAVMGLVVLVPVLPAMMAQFSDVEGVEYLIPLMLTLPALCVALLSPFAGMVVDFFGRRTTLIVALFAYAVAGLLPMVLDSLMAIIAARFALGAMEALIVIASTTLIGDYFQGRSREKWLANQTAIASLSSIPLALVGGMLGEMGWRVPFAAYGLSILFAVALIIWTWEPVKDAEEGQDATLAPISAAKEKAAFPWRHILPIAALAVFGGSMFFTMQIQVSNMLSGYYNISAAGQLGLYSALAGLCVAIGTLLYRQGTAKLHVPTQLFIAFGLIGISYVAMNYSPTVGVFSGTLIVNQLGCGMLLPALVVWAMGRLPFEVRGRGTGLFMSGWWLGQPLGSQLVALLQGRMDGNLPAALQLLGVASLLAAAIALGGRMRRSGSKADVQG